MKNLDLKNKNIVIFGATSFIGFKLTNLLAQKGANLIIHGKSSEKLKDLYEQIYSNNCKIITINSDVLSEKFYLESLKTIFLKFSHIDLLINLIGKFNGLQSITDLSHREWNDLIEVNFSSYWRILKELSPLLGKKRKSKIIFLTNKKIAKGIAYHNSFCLTKDLLKGFVNIYNLEKEKFGIKCSLLDIKKLNVGMTSLLRGKNQFLERDLNDAIKKILNEMI